MKPPFYPLFKHILHGTIWCGEAHSTKLVWVALLDLADVDGNVLMTLPELATLAEVTIPEAEAAIARLSAADPYNNYSSSDTGAHIENVPGGWRVFPPSEAMSEVGI
jgi:hypothetical protein